MKEKKAMSKPTRNLLIAVIVMVGILIFMLILRTNTAVCEFVCRYLVNAYQALAGRVFSVAPFNVFELLSALAVLCVIGCVISSIVLFCKKKKVESRRVMLGLVLTAVCVLNLYVFSAGFAYNRITAPVNAYEGDVDEEFALQTYIALVDDYNSIYDRLEKDDDGAVVCPYSEKELNEKIRSAIDAVLTDKYYYKYTPKAKPVTCSEIMAQCHIAGITFLPTVEPGYNKDMPIVERCSTIAHEFAHSKGVMREDEANVVGIYALLNSGDDYLKYCAYFDVIDEFSHLVSYEDREEVSKLHALNDGYLVEWKKIYAYWSGKNLLGNIGEFFNDLYLKLNGQQDGTGSYDEEPSTDIIDSFKFDEDGNPI
ncbi:MAG: DUF3810 domain-containing protein, partial [Clostridia bacterium]|nr:DUF3810 domain-containing protein [Clostridia bacterium]